MQEGKPVRVAGKKESPTYFGFCCTRGQALPEHIHHPDRLLHSVNRKTNGSFATIRSDRALDEIAEKISRIVDKHGPRSVAIYFGTYVAPYPLTVPFLMAWARSLGTPMIFNSMTIDQPGKDIASAMLGTWQAGQQTFEGSDVRLIIGGNPLVSLSTTLPGQNPGRRLTQALDQGLSLIVIDPRKTETARRARLHLQPRPGEDSAILAVLLNVILHEELYDREFVTRYVTGFDALKEIVSAFDPITVAKRADVPAEDLIEAAHIFARAKRGIAVGATGANMSGHSSLIEYLILCLNTVCGRYIRAGEAVANPGVLLPRAQPKAQPTPPRPVRIENVKMAVRNLTLSAAGMPTAALADEILQDGPDSVRALISVGGNPVAAWPDQRRTVKALQKLDLFVQVDIKMSASAKLADYVIAPKISFEVPTSSYAVESIEQYNPLFGLSEPFGMYVPKLMDPPPNADVIEEWEFFWGLAERMGFPLSLQPMSSPTGVPREGQAPYQFDSTNKPTTDELLEIISRGSRIPLSEVKKHPDGALFPEKVTAAPADPDSTDRLNVGNSLALKELQLISQEKSSAQNPDFPFCMICRRLSNVLNSSGRDLPHLIRKGGKVNLAYMNPQDVESLGLYEGNLVVLTSPHGSIKSIIAIDPALRQGVVSITHAFGDLPDSAENLLEQGSNTSLLTSVEDDYDPFSGIPRMSAVPINVERANLS